jgi:hypothetical protein
VQVASLGVVLACGGGVIGVSITVSILSAFAGVLIFYITIRAFGGRWNEVADMFLRPVVSGTMSVGVAWLIAQQMTSHGDGRWLYLVQLVEICVVSVILNCAMAWIWMRPVWDDLWLRLRRMLPQRAAG